MKGPFFKKNNLDFFKLKLKKFTFLEKTSFLKQMTKGGKKKKKNGKDVFRAKVPPFTCKKKNLKPRILAFPNKLFLKNL